MEIIRGRTTGCGIAGFSLAEVSEAGGEGFGDGPGIVWAAETCDPEP